MLQGANPPRNTPVLNDAGLDGELGCTLHCKCEHLQRTGAFKFRGASNAIACLREAGINGDVATTLQETMAPRSTAAVSTAVPRTW
jgi:threonine dehydratase